jgi:hypothetical protein
MGRSMHGNLLQFRPWQPLTCVKKSRNIFFADKRRERSAEQGDSHFWGVDERKRHFWDI